MVCRYINEVFLVKDQHAACNNHLILLGKTDLDISKTTRGIDDDSIWSINGDLAWQFAER